MGREYRETRNQYRERLQSARLTAERIYRSISRHETDPARARWYEEMFNTLDYALRERAEDDLSAFDA